MQKGNTAKRITGRRGRKQQEKQDIAFQRQEKQGWTGEGAGIVWEWAQSVFAPSRFWSWAAHQAVTWSDHLTVQDGHCSHCFKVVQQLSLSSGNGITTGTGHRRWCQAWSKPSVQGEGSHCFLSSLWPAPNPANGPRSHENGQHLYSQCRSVCTLLMES